MTLKRARNHLLEFATHVRPAFDPTPRHIRELAAALEDVAAGRCDRLMVAMPPQHGKSWLCSQLFPSWMMGTQAASGGVRLATASYSSDRAEENSRDTRALCRDEAFLGLFPEAAPVVQPSRYLGDYRRPDVDRIDQWKAGASVYKAVGVDGPLTGFALDGIIMDDLLKDWAEAQSPTMRDRAWNWYRAVVMTRNPKWQIMVSTRWHPDDPTGRMLKSEPGAWRIINFPAIENEGTPQESGLWECEKFGLERYRRIRAVVGRTMWSCLYQQNPTVSGGNVFKIDRVRQENPESWPAGLPWVRCWDMASSVKQRAGDDPDWTVGVLGAVQRQRDQTTGAMVPHLYIRDVIFLREEAPRRNARIRMAADHDGQVPICVEAFGAYKDAATDLAAALNGLRTVRQLRPPGDKMVKAQPLEPIFEAGNVHVPAGAPWLAEWLRHFEEFPAGAHDDAVDATGLVWHESATPRAGLAIPGMMQR